MMLSLYNAAEFTHTLLVMPLLQQELEKYIQGGCEE